MAFYLRTAKVLVEFQIRARRSHAVLLLLRWATKGHPIVSPPQQEHGRFIRPLSTQSSPSLARTQGSRGNRESLPKRLVIMKLPSRLSAQQKESSAILGDKPCCSKGNTREAEKVTPLSLDDVTHKEHLCKLAATYTECIRGTYTYISV